MDANMEIYRRIFQIAIFEMSFDGNGAYSSRNGSWKHRNGAQHFLYIISPFTAASLEEVWVNIQSTRTLNNSRMVPSHPLRSTKIHVKQE